MSKRAEERAFAYQRELGMIDSVSDEHIVARRMGFYDGYRQAEKDIKEWVEEQLAILDKQTLLHPDDDVFWGQRNAYKQMKDKLNSL